MNITIINIAIIAFATWRISSLVANETGPFHIFLKLRNTIARATKPNNFFGKFHLWEGMQCEWCNSIWFSFILVPLWWWIGDGFLLFILPLTISTLVIIVKYIVQALEGCCSYVEKLNKENG